MIISRTPLRVSFAGGGTDLPNFYRQHGGAVLSMSIQKYIYLAMHSYFEKDGYILKYSKLEAPRTLGDIEHRIIKQVFSDLDIRRVDFNSSADVPAGTGMGSSSAFTVGILNLCYAYKGQFVSKATLAEMACEIEINKLNEPIGKQDQYGCALGGINFIQFFEDESVAFEPVPLSYEQKRQLESSLMMFYLGGTRSASAILSEQSKNSVENVDIIKNLRFMAGQAHSLRRDICQSVDVLGEYLNEGWMRKRKLAPGVSNPLVDGCYDRALAAGATGGKLLGAGGSGFLLVYCPQKKRQDVIEALAEFDLHEVRMDNAGATIVYSDA
ncbi:GHMP kinase [Ensifer sp. ENS06]|uniref:GHMP family kinase ATP-binding protein n=1 Tax=Ensifer sp. ENS06 TaxID=2769276 RepID=UPI00178604CA|nr:GHMP kinase [Ensifer sp. ENS06]MBD9625265.1 GHMP kinase [Ensifer sp. ENS06]